MGFAIVFFLAAVDVVFAAFYAVFLMIVRPSAAVFTFTSELFLLIFGIIMLILDFPLDQIPTARQWNGTHEMRKNIYKFMLFLTRFTGRGFWYMFLGTMVWASLWDQNQNKVLGAILAIFPMVVGFAAMIYGFTLSVRLQKVRQTARLAPRDSNGDVLGCPDNGMGATHMKQFLQNNNEVGFTDAQVKLVLVGLSTEYPDGGDTDNIILSKSDYKNWMDAGCRIN